jgi:S-formylglutathione hydrolase FrmB
VTHTCRELSGGHDWDYWNLHIREALDFHARNLHLSPVPGTA